jgi:hypothetical protein
LFFHFYSYLFLTTFPFSILFSYFLSVLFHIVETFPELLFATSSCHSCHIF